MKPTFFQSGFTLIEMAVVLVIIGIVVGSFIGSFTQRIESSRRGATAKQLEEIKIALLGFASVNGRLPCPAQPASEGLEVRIPPPFLDQGKCLAFKQHGFVPGRTLGLSGAYNDDNLLLDSWRNPIRYSVTKSTTSNWEFTRDTNSGGMRDTTMSVLDPSLKVCDSFDADNDGDCDGNTLVSEAPFVVISLGKDGSDFVGAPAVVDSDQSENASEAAFGIYTVADDSVFVSKDYSSADATADQFDDLIIWVSKYVLYSRMIEAGQLP